MYVVQQTDFDLTKYYTLTAVRESLGLVDGQVTGLVKATYLGPDIVNPAAFTPDGIEADDTVQEPDNLSTSLVLFAVGGCAFAASVGLVYYLRRQSYSSSGAATQAAGSDQQTSLRSGQDHPLSPFSEMLPSAYRFDQDGQMSAILELDDESATPRSAIAISESGFTIDEEGSSAISSLGDTASVTQNSVLGARKRQVRLEIQHELFRIVSTRFFVCNFQFSNSLFSPLNSHRMNPWIPCSSFCKRTTEAFSTKITVMEGKTKLIKKLEVSAPSPMVCLERADSVPAAPSMAIFSCQR